MNTLKKATKNLSVADIVLCLLTVVLSFIFPAATDRPELKDTTFDIIMWMVMGVAVISAIVVLIFTTIVIIRTVCSKRIIKEKSVIIACAVNAVFVILILAFIDKLDLWFVFY